MLQYHLMMTDSISYFFAIIYIIFKFFEPSFILYR